MTDLFSYAAAVRKHDPQTSKDAAASMDTVAGKQHQAILRVMRESHRPLAPEEIGDRLGYPIWRRMKELVDGGLIQQAMLPDGKPDRHMNRSGRWAFRFKIRED